MKVILAIAFFFVHFLIQAQVDPELLLGVHSATSLEIAAMPTANIAEGTLIYDSDLKSLLHFNTSDWVVVTDEANATKVDNEQIFEDATHYYVSLLIDTASWRVIRYDKTDINAEAQASGTGTQPTSLAACTALTYL